MIATCIPYACHAIAMLQVLNAMVGASPDSKGVVPVPKGWRAAGRGEGLSPQALLSRGLPSEVS